MQIQLCEDDGLFHEGGIPTMVVLVVKFDDGKTRRIPYPADKSIAALYHDLNYIAPKVAEAPQQEFISLPEIESTVYSRPSTDKEVFESLKNPPKKNWEDKSNIIEKEDIVTLVKLNPRTDTYSGTESPLMVGMDYRIIAVMGPKIPTSDGKGIQTIVKGYEVIDDHAATPERMVVTPDEVQLKSKRLSKVITKVSRVEEILPCPSCQKTNSLLLEVDEFKGTCEACNQDIVIARIIRKCETAKCGHNVSCFDVGGKYEGTCGQCKAKIEVPYA